MAIERTTQQRGVSQSLLDMSNNLRSLQDAQHRISSGKQLTKLSDDPTAVGAAVRLHSSIGRSDQYMRNIDDGVARLTQADGALQQISDQLARIKDLAIQARNGAIDATGRSAIASEMSQLREQMLGAANSSYLGQPVFGGTVGGTRAYDATGAYVGDSQALERNVAPGVRVAVSVNGASAFTTGGVSLFDAVQNIIDSVASDPGTIGTNADALDAHIATLHQGLAEVGGRMNRLDALKAHMDESIASMQQQLSSIEDVDLEQALLDVKMREVAYQAALSATARVIQPSLVDFLK